MEPINNTTDMFMGCVTHYGGSTRHISNTTSGIVAYHLIVSSEYILAEWNYQLFLRILLLELSIFCKNCKKFDSKLRK